MSNLQCKATLAGIFIAGASLICPQASKPTVAQANLQHSKVTICIDPGHPSEVNSGKTIQNGTTETHCDWVVAQKLNKSLRLAGYNVVMTKSSENQLVENKERALIGNRAHAALTIRLHCDAGPSTGYAVYYPDRTGKAHGATGPAREIIQTSGVAAKCLDQGLAETLKGELFNGGVRGDSSTFIGSKQGALTGSIFSTIPIVTIEMVVLQNRKDAAYIKSEIGSQHLADGIAAGIKLFVEKYATKNRTSDKTH